MGIMGASTGVMGTARAKYHLRQCFVFLNRYPMNRPEVMVPFVQEKVDRNGHLIDQETREIIREFLQSLVSWARR